MVIDNARGPKRMRALGRRGGRKAKKTKAPARPYPAPRIGVGSWPRAADAVPAQLFGIWCLEGPGVAAHWLRAGHYAEAIAAFPNQRQAFHAAAHLYGARTYTDVKRRRLAVVRPLS